MSDYIFSDKPAAVAGFAYRFVDSFCSSDDSFENPLSSVFFAAVNGAVYGFGAKVVSGFIPSPAKPVLPVILAAAAVKKHPEIVPNIIKGAQEGGTKAVEDLRENGMKKLTDAANDVRETATDAYNQGKELFKQK